MDRELSDFLETLGKGVERSVVWGETLRLSMVTWACEREPPLEWVTSARAVVLRGDEVLVVRDPASIHILPGGRREPGESLEETARREVIEETGWTLADLAPLGLLHFHHLDPRPPDYPYMYPDFLHVVFCAEALAEEPHRREVGGYELEAGFRSLSGVPGLPLGKGERMLLDSFLARRTLRAWPGR